jgi:hypothetical protein
MSHLLKKDKVIEEPDSGVDNLALRERITPTLREIRSEAGMSDPGGAIRSMPVVSLLNKINQEDN